MGIIEDYMNDDDAVAIQTSKPSGGSIIDLYLNEPDEVVKPQALSGDKAWWKGKRDDSYEGIVKRFGIGFARGAKDVLDTAAHGLASGAEYISDKVLPESLSSKVKKSAENAKLADVIARDEFNKEYPSSDGLVPTATDVGRFIGQATATAPVMAGPVYQGIRTGFGAAKAGAPIVNKLASAVAEGGLGGAAFNAATSSTNNKSLAENVGEGVVGGAIGGPVIKGLASAGSGIGSKILSSISPERAALAKRAANFGIDLKAGQVSESPIWKKYNQVSGWLPFSGEGKAADKQINQFTKAVSNTFGEDTHNITPQLLDKAQKRIGSDYDTVAKNTTINADKQLTKDFAKIYHEAQIALDDNQFKKFENQVQLIASKFRSNNGVMPGEAWQSFRHINSPLSKVANGRDTDTGYYVKSLKAAMDGAFNRAAPSDMQALLKQANSQYKAMKTIKELAENDSAGHVSPMRLMSKVTKSPGGKLRSGALGELADIGRAFFPQPSDSGTPLGEAALNKIGSFAGAPLAGLAAAGNALASGSYIVPGLEAAAGLALNRAVRSGVNSSYVRNRMINTAQGKGRNLLDSVSNVAIPYSSNAVSNDKRPKVIIDTNDFNHRSLSDALER